MAQSKTYADILKKKQADDARLKGVQAYAKTDAFKKPTLEEKKKADAEKAKASATTSKNPGYGAQNEGKNIKPVKSIPVHTAYGVFDTDAPGYSEMTLQGKKEFNDKAKRSIEKYHAEQKSKPTTSAPDLNEEPDNPSEIDVLGRFADVVTKMQKAPLKKVLEPITKTLRAGSDTFRVLGDKDKPGWITEKGRSNDYGFFMNMIAPDKAVEGLINLPSSALSSIADVADPETGFTETAMGVGATALNFVGGRGAFLKLKGKLKPTRSPLNKPTITERSAGEIYNAGKIMDGVDDLSPLNKPEFQLPSNQPSKKGFGEGFDAGFGADYKPEFQLPSNQPSKKGFGEGFDPGFGADYNPHDDPFSGALPDGLKWNGNDIEWHLSPTLPHPLNPHLNPNSPIKKPVKPSAQSPLNAPGEPIVPGAYDPTSKLNDAQIEFLKNQGIDPNTYDPDAWINTLFGADFNPTKGVSFLEPEIDAVTGLPMFKPGDSMDVVPELNPKQRVTIPGNKSTVTPIEPIPATTQKSPNTPKTPQNATSSNVGSNVVKDLPVADKPVGDLVATANRVTDELLKQVGSEGRVKVKPEKMAKFAEDAKTVNVDDLIAELGEKPRTLQPHEELALGARLSEAMRKYDDALNQFHEAAGKGNVPKSVSDNLDAMRGQVDEVIRAGGNAGTGWHQTGMARQALIRSDYSLQGMIQKAYKETKKAKIPLDKHTRAYYEEAAARYKQAEAELADIKARAAENPTKFTEKEVTRNARRTNIIKEHEDLLSQIKAIKETPSKKSGMGGNRQRGAIEVISPEKAKLYGLYGKLGWNLAKQGAMNVGDIFIQVSKIAKEAGHKITKQGFIDAMDDIRLNRSGTAAAKAAKENLKARLALNKEIERGSTRGIAATEAKATVKEAKAASRAATFEQVKASAKANKLKGEITDIKKMLKDGDYYMAKAEKAGDTAEIAKLKAEKKALNDQMNGKIDELGAFEPTVKTPSGWKAATQAGKDARASLNEAKAIQRLESQVDDLNKRIDNWDVSDAKGPGRPLEPSVKNALISKRGQLQKQLDKMKDSLGTNIDAKLLTDHNSLARMDRKMKDLNTMISTGDYYGTGVTRKSSVLSDAVAVKEYQLAKLQAEVDANINNLGKSKAERTIEEAFNLSRGLKLGLDMGALGRQGLDVLYINPRVWFDGAKAGVQSMSAVKAHSINNKHLNDPEVVRWMKDGLPIDKLGSHGEEGFGSSFLKKIPGHSALERFHVTFQNEIRIGMAKYMAKAGDLTTAEREGVADFIGAMTGRSNLLKAPSKLTSAVFTAPKMYAGQVEVMTAWMNPKYSPLMGGMGKSSKAVRAVVARRTIGRLGMLVGLKTFADKLGGDFSLNPDDSDFLKMRIGDRVYDVGGGYTPYYRAVFSTLNDLVSPSRDHDGEFVKKGFALAQTKISPILSGANAMLSGEDFVGDPRFRDKYDKSKFKLNDAKSWVETLGTITANDIYDMLWDRDKYKDSSKAAKLTTLGLAFAGVGATSFDDKKPKKSGAEGTVMGQGLAKLGIPIVKRTPEEATKEAQSVVKRELSKIKDIVKKKKADIDADKYLSDTEKEDMKSKVDEEAEKKRAKVRG